LKALGFTKKGLKIFSLGIQEDTFEYTFDMKNWSVSNLNHNQNHDIFYNNTSYKILLVDTQNLYFLNDFLNLLISNNNLKYEAVILMNITDLQELIKTKNVFIYIMIQENVVVNCYFFKKPCTFVTKDTQFLTLYASIKTTQDDDNELFIKGFKISLAKLMSMAHTPNKDNNEKDIIIYSHLVVEDISDNHFIIENLKIKTFPCLVSPIAYFFYNFAHQPFKSNEVLIIS
jgi:hypothetical protein